jgi:hypothetical protein
LRWSGSERKKGGYFHEPPYTEEEEMELYKAADYSHGPIRIHHPQSPPAAPKRRKIMDDELYEPTAEELEQTIKRLAERLDDTREGSAEHTFGLRQLKGMRGSSELALMICEEYNYWG